MSATRPTSANQSDLLLWVAGGAIAAVGAAWLVITQPWASSGGDAPAPTDAPAAEAEAAAETGSSAATEPIADADAPETTLDNPLRMAELAYDAGMLIEPEEYSAWTLYARVFKAEPDNTVARDGLNKVADDLVRRGATALEQGRFDDARATVERIRAALPAHAGAKELALKIWPQMAPTLQAHEPLTLTEPPRVTRVETAAPARPQVDPVVQASEAFNKAMAEGRLLTPSDQSAKHFVGALTQANADHELTQRARTTLSQEFLSRAAQSIEALDPEAAGIWIDEAEALVGGDDEGVRRAHASLTAQLIAMESAKPVPASALKIATYVAPVYPERALERSVEGWVDVEFTVGTDGKTRNVVVTESSHESYFRREATAAVAQWQFEPRQFMGRAIDQSSYTRIRFVH